MKIVNNNFVNYVIDSYLGEYQIHNIDDLINHREIVKKKLEQLENKIHLNPQDLDLFPLYGLLSAEYSSLSMAIQYLEEINTLYSSFKEININKINELESNFIIKINELSNIKSINNQ